MTSHTLPLPLAGNVVVDLTQVVSGAVTTMLLADFGAEVIKVEPPGGEAYRRFGHPIQSEHGETNLNILRFSRGKKSVVLDLKNPAGRDVLESLLTRSDVLVENFRPGVLSRLGFSADRLRQINDRLIYTTVSGFGHDDLYDGPYRDRAAYAIVTEAMAGLTHLAAGESGEPVWMGFAMADIFAGVLAFAGTVLALHSRSRRDPHRRVDIAMYDGSLFMNDLAIAMQSVLATAMRPGRYALQEPWGPFPANDGWFVIAVLTSDQWRALCRVLGRQELADDSRLIDGEQRARHHDDLVAPAVTDWSTRRSRAECVEILSSAGVPAALINSAADILDCPQVTAREMLVDVDEPVVGGVRLVGNPIKLDGLATNGRRRIAALGEHTDELLATYIGLSPDDIAERRRSGAFGDA